MLEDKVISKRRLDQAIELTREYWHGNRASVSTESIIVACERIQEATGINWYSMQGFLSGIFPRAGIKHEATNEDIYAILRLLGWEVSD